MSLETQSLRRNPDAYRDKPQVERTEHANHERPAAQVHPRAVGIPVQGDGVWTPPRDWAQYLN